MNQVTETTIVHKENHTNTEIFHTALSLLQKSAAWSTPLQNKKTQPKAYPKKKWKISTYNSVFFSLLQQEEEQSKHKVWIHTQQPKTGPGSLFSIEQGHFNPSIGGISLIPTEGPYSHKFTSKWAHLTCLLAYLSPILICLGQISAPISHTRNKPFPPSGSLTCGITNMV